MPRFWNSRNRIGEFLVTLSMAFWQIALPTPPAPGTERRGLILFRVYPAIPDSITRLVLRTLAIDRQWGRHANPRVHRAIAPGYTAPNALDSPSQLAFCSCSNAWCSRLLM